MTLHFMVRMSHLYGVIKLEEKYAYDKAKEAQNVYGTTEVDHPGVKRVYEKEMFI